jgi:hypothetical protein
MDETAPPERSVNCAIASGNTTGKFADDPTRRFGKALT